MRAVVAAYAASAARAGLRKIAPSRSATMRPCKSADQGRVHGEAAWSVCVCVYIYMYIYIYIYIYIYYYTPLPLNLANKQQATSNNKQQQARLRAVLAIAPSQSLGPDSTLAILEPRWCPCQSQVLSQKLTGGGPGRWRQVGRCPPKSAQFWAKNSHFSPKTAPKPGRNAQAKANGCYNAHAARLSRDQGTFGAL